MEKKLFLIDGTALIYRSFYAFIKNPLSRKDGFPTSAIYGTINTVLRLMEEYKIEDVFITFDRKEKTFRHKLTDTYKANRPPIPDDLIPQIKPILDFFEKINMYNLSCAGYEADDVLATIAEKMKQHYEKVYIVSGDKDFVQLVDEKISLLNPFKKSVINLDDVYDKYGVKVEQFIDYLALMGDSADNIPGVKGIGPKTAEKLLSEYPNIDAIYENIDKISKSKKSKLQKNKENAYLSQELVTIEKNVPLGIINPKKFSYEKQDLKAAFDFLEEFGISSLKKKIYSIIGEKSTESTNKISFEAITIDNEEKLDSLIQKLGKESILAIDTETTSLDVFKAELVGISMAFNPYEAYYLPFTHNMAQNLAIDTTIPKLKNAINGKTIIVHNMKYDYQILEKYDWSLEGNLFDTMIASYLLKPEQRKHGLDRLAKMEFNYEMKSFEEVAGKGKNQLTFDFVEVEEASFYAAEDSFLTYKLYQKYSKKLEDNNLYDLFKNIEMPLIKVLVEMEQNGVYIDKDFLNNLSEEINLKIADLQKKIFDLAGEQFNLNSPKQLGEILFDKMNIPVVKKTKTGYSTNRAVLDKLDEDGYEIASLILEYRELFKLDSTYVKALPALINEKTKRIHSSFNQTITTTGRLSSSNPNLQNIPIRTKLGKEIRKAFHPQTDDAVIVAADYSQVELRILALLSQDPNLLRTYKEGKDIHKKTAALIFNKEVEEVTQEDRYRAKTINFGIIYGMGSRALSKQLNISTKEAKKFIDNYFKSFPTIKDFMNKKVESARENGYAKTIFNRILHLKDINSSNNRMKSFAERIAVNMPIQGSAADIIKIAMINLHEKIKNRDEIKMMIQVHDELVFEVKKDSLDEMKTLIKNEMESVLPEKLKNIIPLKVDVGVGKNWYEAH